MVACRGPLAEVHQYQVETEERDDGSNDKDVHVLCAKREKISIGNRPKTELRTFFVLSS